MKFLIILGLFLLFDSIQSTEIYKESINDILSHCNTYQKEINSRDRTPHLCEKEDPEGDYRHYISVMETRFSKQKFLCMIVIKYDNSKLKFRMTLSHEDFDVNAYGVKYSPRENNTWSSEIKFKISIMVVVPKEGKEVPEINGLELNDKDACPSCGKRIDTKALVSAGTEVKQIDYPWHATLFYMINKNLEYKCGGIIISAKVILTAAHCIVQNGQTIIENTLKVKLVKGDSLFSDSEIFNVDTAIAHEAYDPVSLKNDIAILKLKRRIELRSSNFRAICLPLRKMISEEFSTGTVVGYGSTDKSMKHSDVLREVHLPVSKKRDCMGSDEKFFTGHLDIKANFCAGDLKSPKGVCGGDSGSGFLIEHNGLFYVKGIVSMTKQSRDPLNPTCSQGYAIFTEVAHYLNWIKDKSGTY